MRQACQSLGAKETATAKRTPVTSALAEGDTPCASRVAWVRILFQVPSLAWVREDHRLELAICRPPQRTGGRGTRARDAARKRHEDHHVGRGVQDPNRSSRSRPQGKGERAGDLAVPPLVR